MTEKSVVTLNIKGPRSYKVSKAVQIAETASRIEFGELGVRKEREVNKYLVNIKSQFCET